jgi:hypothetical protein
MGARVNSVWRLPCAQPWRIPVSRGANGSQQQAYSCPSQGQMSEHTWAMTMSTAHTARDPSQKPWKCQRLADKVHSIWLHFT